MRSVLFVDDDPTVLRTFPRVFRRDPFEIVTAPLASVALEVLATREISIVVSDHRMPGMLGLELLGVIAKTYPHVGRVLLTGDTGDLWDNEGALAIAHAVLRKPSSPADIRATIELVGTIVADRDDHALVGPDHSPPGPDRAGVSTVRSPVTR